MSETVVDVPNSPPRPFLSPIPRLRIGSTLVTRRGVVFRVRKAVVMVAKSGGESPSLVVDRIRDGQSVELFLTVGILANLTRGSTHKPGPGTRIDWAQVPRRPLTDIALLGNPNALARWRPMVTTT